MKLYSIILKFHKGRNHSLIDPESEQGPYQSKVQGGAQTRQVPPQSTSPCVVPVHFQSPLQPLQALAPVRGWTESLTWKVPR